MKMIVIFLLMFLNLSAQESLEVKYLIRFNDDLNGERRDRLHDGILRVADGKSFFYMAAKEKQKPKDENHSVISFDTSFIVVVNQFKNELYAVDFLLGKGKIWVKDSLYPMKWAVDTLSKKIGDLNCFRATTIFRGRNYIAWFTPDIPIPMGPWKIGGLPGLILELEDDKQNMLVKLQSITPKPVEVKLPIPKLSWEQFVRLRKKMFTDFSASFSARQKSDCLTCKTELTISEGETWEKY